MPKKLTLRLRHLLEMFLDTLEAYIVVGRLDLSPQLIPVF
jgi:hypothetical protein